MRRKGDIKHQECSKAMHLTADDVRRYLTEYELTQRRFCRWIGISPRTFQLWIASGSFPRSLEIIITHEPPPQKLARKSLVGPKMKGFNVEPGSAEASTSAQIARPALGMKIKELSLELGDSI